MYIFDEVKRVWESAKVDSSERYKQGRKVSAAISEALNVLIYTRKVLDALDDSGWHQPDLYADELCESLFFLAQFNVSSHLPEQFVDSEGTVLSDHEMKGALIVAFRIQLEQDASSRSWGDSLINIPDEIELLSFEAAELEESDSDMSICFDECSDCSDASSLEETRYINIQAIKTAFLEVLSRVGQGMSLAAVDEKIAIQRLKLDSVSYEGIKLELHYEMLLEKIMSWPQATELLLVSDHVLDEDLQDVMTYRLNKNPRLVVMDLFEHVQILEYAKKFGRASVFDSIRKLGILHHSGRRAEETSGYAYMDYLDTIGESLPKVSSVVLRGCGMVKEKPAKRFAIEAAQVEDGRLDSEKQVKQALRDGMTFFKRSTQGAPKRKTMRQYTLDVDTIKGNASVTDFTHAIVLRLQASGLGRALPDGARPTVKCYLAGYKGDPVNGAIAHDGTSVEPKRYLTAPKAIRFSI